MKHGGGTGAPGIAQRRPLPTALEFPNPAAPAEAAPGQIAAVTDAPLTDEAFAYGVATVLYAELARRDAEIAELRAGLAALKKAGTEPDLDAWPPRGGPLKRVCQVAGSTGYSETRLRTWARSGAINSKYVGGRLFIDERDVPVKKRKSG